MRGFFEEGSFFEGVLLGNDPALGVAIDLAVKSGAVLLCGWLAAVACRVPWGNWQASAAVRHRVWSLTFAGVLLLPCATWLLPEWRVAVWPADVVREEVAAREISGSVSEGMEDRTERGEVEAEGVDVEEELRPLGLPMEGWSEIEDTAAGGLAVDEVADVRGENSRWSVGMRVVGLWGVGALAAALPLGVGLWMNRRTLRRARELESGEWQELVRELSGRLGLLRGVKLYELPGEKIPVTWGVWRPVILLPESARDWSEERRRCVLLHELAHIQRRDVLWQIVGRLGASVCWFNPMGWYGLRQLRLERELACDDAVVSLGEGATAYADQLLDLATQLREHRLVVGVTMGRLSGLETRIRALLDPLRAHGPVTRRVAVGLGLGAMVVLAATASLRLVAAEGEVVVEAAPVVEKPVVAEGEVVRGMCVDEEGNGLGDVEVKVGYFERLNPVVKMIEEVRSDAKGEFELRSVDPLIESERVFVFMVKRQGRGASLATSLTRGKPRPALEFVLKPTVQMQGRLVDPEGKPVSGAMVDTNSVYQLPAEMKPGQSNTNGEFIVEDLWVDFVEQNFGESANGNMRSAPIFVTHPDFARIPLSVSRVKGVIEVKLQPAAILEGALMDHGVPVEGGIVHAQPSNLPENEGIRLAWGTARTNSAGEYRIQGLRAGTYDICLLNRPEGRIAAAVENFVIEGGKVNVASPMEVTTGGMIQGRLVHASTGETMRLRDGDVIAIEVQGPSRPRNRGVGERVLVGKDGIFELQVVPGKNQVQIKNARMYSGLGDSYGMWSSVRDVEVSEGGIIKVEFPVLRRDGGEVSLNTEEGNELTTMRRVEKPKEEDFDSVLQDRRSPLGAEEFPSVTQSSELISVQCADERGKPMGDVSVSWYRRGNSEDQWSMVATTFTGSRGGATFDTNQPGRSKKALFAVVVKHAGYGTVVKSGTQKSLESVKLILRRAVPIRGRVTDEAGNALSGVVIFEPPTIPGWWETPENLPEFVKRGTTDEKGEFSITDFSFGEESRFEGRGVNGDAKLSGTFAVGPLGAMLFAYHPDCFMEGVAQQSLREGQATIVLRRAPSVTGRIMMAGTNVPLQGVRVRGTRSDQPKSSRPVEGYQVLSTRSGSDGRFRLGAIFPGAYQLSIDDPDPALSFRNVEVAVPDTKETIEASPILVLKKGIVKGKVIDDATGKPVSLAPHEKMQVFVTKKGDKPEGPFVAAANVEKYGLFIVRVEPGANFLRIQNHSSFKFLPRNGEGIEEGLHKVDVPADGAADFEVRVRRPAPKTKGEAGQFTSDSAIDELNVNVVISPGELESKREKVAIEAIEKLGGEVKSEHRYGYPFVVGVNLNPHGEKGRAREIAPIASDEGMFYLQRFPLLKWISMSGEQATDEGLNHLSGMNELESVMIHEAEKVTDAGVAHLQYLPRLKHVSISRAKVTDESVRMLSQVGSLESLNLQGGTFTDQALEYASRISGLRKLSLDTGMTAFSESGIRHLKELSKLELLKLQRTVITDGGLRSLGEIPSLRKLFIDEGGYSPSALEELRRLNPKLRVITDKNQYPAAEATED